MADLSLDSKTELSGLKSQLAQREAELQIINNVQQGLGAHLEVQAIYDLVGDKIRDIFHAQVVMISTYDWQTQTIEHRYAIERGERIYAPGHHPIRGFRIQVVETRQPVLVGVNVAELAAQLGQPTLPGTITPKTWLGVPLIVEGQVTGILSLQDVEHENAFGEPVVRLLQTLANAMSLALENARLFDETQRLLTETEQRNAELAIINSVQEGLASKLDIQAIYELIGEKVREVFNVQVVDIVIYDPNTNLISMPYSYEKGDRSVIAPQKPYGFRLEVINSRAPLLINQNFAELASQHSNPLITGEWPKSAMFVPLLVDDKVKGIISIQDIDREDAYSASDVRLLQTLANSMSVALENARLWEQEKLYRKALEREFEIGREIQAGFLPKTLPQPEGWEIAASLKSAREVAGDFYDVFYLSEDKIGLVIADVCDKGLGAALFMTLFRSLLRAVSNIDFYARVESADGDSPAARLKHAISLTNNYIAETHGDTGMFATVFFGILDTHTGALTYINGGHLPPLLVNQHGVKEILKFTGPALGVMSDMNYVIREVIIEQGESFFAYTDGLTDTTNLAGEFFSEKELISLLLENQPLTPLLAQIQKRVEDHAAGARQFDDITMLALRRV